MDYKAKYESALQRAKRMMSQKEIEYLFPELKESEDERIRKEIVDFVQSFIDCHDKPDAKRDEHPHWISVEDELPKDGEYIIITDGGDLTTTALYGGYDGLTKDTFIKNITHWMPLPSTDHLADASKKADHSIDGNKKVEHLIDTNKMMEGE